MAATQNPEITAEVVGRAFVSQFYQILHTTPELVYRFFNDSSTMSRPGPAGDLLTVTTMNGIKDVILSLDCTNYKAEILTADTQSSHMNGVTVLVTGCLTGQDNVRRKFTESFFLAPQDNGYFVHNDVFRFITEDSFPVTDSVEVHHIEDVKPAETVTVTAVAPVQEAPQAQLVDDSVEKHNAAVEEKLEPVTTVPVTQPKPAVVERALPPQPTVEPNVEVPPTVEVSSNGDEDAPKKSYASLLKNSKQGRSAFPVHGSALPAKHTRAKPAPKTVPPSGQQTQATATVPAAAATAASESSVAANHRNAPSNGNATSNGHIAGKGQGHSVYIGHLPYDATAELVEKEFNKFGRIRKNGIQVRSNKGYVFGFVEYEDASAQEKAIELGTIFIGGKEVFIEEKKTAARADDYYPSGRGGFHNDNNYRRGGNYSNGRGYGGRSDYGNHRNGEGRNDYGNHRNNGDGPFRGNRNGNSNNNNNNNNGYVHQNGGGRGAHQASAAPK